MEVASSIRAPGRINQMIRLLFNVNTDLRLSVSGRNIYESNRSYSVLSKSFTRSETFRAMLSSSDFSLSELKFELPHKNRDIENDVHPFTPKIWKNLHFECPTQNGTLRLYSHSHFPPSR
jgi:hypothetical protein